MQSPKLRKISKALVICTVGLLIGGIEPAVSQETKFAYDSHKKRDPFVPLVTESSKFIMGLEGVETIDDVTLEGIVWDPDGNSIAIINGVILKEKDEVGVIRLVEIKPANIVLIINEREYEIPLIEKGGEGDEE